MTRREKVTVWAFGVFLFLSVWGMLFWASSYAKNERQVLECRIDALEQGRVDETCDR